MDRPEWIAIDPHSGQVYCTLTNNPQRGQERFPAVDAANPRSGNVMGQIIRWKENGDFDGATFTWNHLLLAGDPVNARAEAKQAAAVSDAKLAETDKLKAQHDKLGAAERERAQAVAALLAGEVQLTFVDSPAIMSHVKAGKLRGLAVSTAQRVPTLPELPTVAEAGVPGYAAETWLGLAVADVSGKGIPAALLMAGFRMSLLAEIRNEFAIRAVMRKVNQLLHESTDRGKFVTAYYGVLDWRNGVLIFSNAGHNPPLLLRPDGTTDRLSEGGVALGVLEDTRYEERPVAVAAGDVIVLYTDGVSEAENEAGEQFGEERIERIIRSYPQHTARELMQDVVAAVLDWAGEKGLGDDLTLMIVKKLPDA